MTARITGRYATDWQSPTQILPTFTIEGLTGSAALDAAQALIGSCEQRGWLCYTIVAHEATGEAIERKVERPGIWRVI